MISMRTRAARKGARDECWETWGAEINRPPLRAGPRHRLAPPPRHVAGALSMELAQVRRSDEGSRRSRARRRGEARRAQLILTARPDGHSCARLPRARKTLAARSFARVASIGSPDPFTPDFDAVRLTGCRLDQRNDDFEFRRPDFTNLLLADESTAHRRDAGCAIRGDAGAALTTRA